MDKLSGMAEEIGKHHESAGIQHTKQDKHAGAPVNIKLEGKAKENYLSNLNNCMSYLQKQAENLESAYLKSSLRIIAKTTTKDDYLWLGKTYGFSMQKTDILQNIKSLISILYQRPQIEVSPATGMPATPMIMAIDYAGKNIDNELEELTSKVSSGFAKKNDKELNIENLLIERIKSKIYAFDTPAAELLQAEGKPLHEIIAPELALRDRNYFLDAIKRNDFSIENDIPRAAAIIDRLAHDSYGISKTNIDEISNNNLKFFVSDLNFTGYDFMQGSFSKSILRVFVNEKKAKKIFLSKDVKKKEIEETNAELRPKYQKILGEAFKRGSIDHLYKDASNIKYFYPWDIMKLTLKRFYDANTDSASLGLPEHFFRNYPDAVVMDIASERITAFYNKKEDLMNKNYHPEIKKSTNIFRLYWHKQLDKHLDKSQELKNIKPIYIKNI